METIKQLAERLYECGIHKRCGVSFEDLSIYEQRLWRQSAKQVKDYHQGGNEKCA